MHKTAMIFSQNLVVPHINGDNDTLFEKTSCQNNEQVKLSITLLLIMLLHLVQVSVSQLFLSSRSCGGM